MDASSPAMVLVKLYQYESLRYDSRAKSGTVSVTFERFTPSNGLIYPVDGGVAHGSTTVFNDVQSLKVPSIAQQWELSLRS